MPIPPGYASVSVERICQHDFEELEIDIPGGDGEKTLKDALHGIILWPKCYIIIILENDGSPRDHLGAGAAIVFGAVIGTTCSLTFSATTIRQFG
jgi:hypothetical protein